jgi:hypothetical protein
MQFLASSLSEIEIIQIAQNIFELEYYTVALARFYGAGLCEHSDGNNFYVVKTISMMIMHVVTLTAVHNP